MTMNEPGKSDRPVVPPKSANMSFWDLKKLVERVKASGSGDRPRAGRGLAKENEEHGTAGFFPAGPAKQVDRTQSRLGEGKPLDEDLHSALDRVRQAACRDRELKFTTLWHHVYSIDRLREAYLACKRDASAGVDGQTW